MPPSLVQMYSDRRLELRGIIVRHHEGDVGNWLNAQDWFFQVQDWPGGMRDLLYKHKNYEERFTLMWFLLSNGMYPPQAIDTVLVGQNFVDDSMARHLESLVKMYEKTPERYSSPMMMAYKKRQ